jgi:hypothetical protein
MAELGNLTVSYCPPSTANVNCENPHPKPVSQQLNANWGRQELPLLCGRFSNALHSTILRFTGCAQRTRVCSLRETGLRVQSQKEEYFEARNSFR